MINFFFQDKGLGVAAATVAFPSLYPTQGHYTLDITVKKKIIVDITNVKAEPGLVADRLDLGSPDMTVIGFSFFFFFFLKNC